MRALACVIVLVACGPTAPPVAPMPLVPAEPTAPTEGTEGTEPASNDPEGLATRPAITAVVTGQMLADAYQQVSVLDAFDEVLANFTNRVGAPTSVGKSPIGGPHAQVWAIVERDTCYLLTLEANALGNTEAHYGSFQRGQFLFDQCAAATAQR